MANKKSWSFEDWLLLVGGSWLIYKLFKSPSEAARIAGLPGAKRKFLEYADTKEKSIFNRELEKLSNAESGEIIRLIMTARILTTPELPIYEKYPGYTFWGVIRDLNRGWRIFIHQLPNGTFVMLSFYKKQKGKAPKHEIEKAEARAKEVAKLHRYR